MSRADDLRQKLREAPPSKRLALLRSLRQSDDESIASVLVDVAVGFVATEAPPPTGPEKAFARQGLESMGGAAVPAILAALAAADREEHRATLAAALGRARHGSPEVLAALEGLLAEGSSPEGTCAAAEALGRIGQASEAGIELLKGEVLKKQLVLLPREDGTEQTISPKNEAAARALGKIGHIAAAATLVEAISRWSDLYEHDDPPLCEALAEALGRFGPTAAAAVEPLGQLAKGAHPGAPYYPPRWWESLGARRAGAAALAQIGTAEARELLYGALGGTKEAQDAAVFGLRHLRKPSQRFVDKLAAQCRSDGPQATDATTALAFWGMGKVIGFERLCSTLTELLESMPGSASPEWTEQVTAVYRCLLAAAAGDTTKREELAARQSSWLRIIEDSPDWMVHRQWTLDLLSLDNRP